MISETDIDLIRDSAEAIFRADVAATNTFYTNLFNVAASVRPLFPEDMFDQSKKLLDSIVFVIENLEEPDKTASLLRAMGARHVGYGAEPEHYPIVSAVLIDTIESVMTTGWSEAHRDAWVRALDWVTEAMLDGAKERAA